MKKTVVLVGVLAAAVLFAANGVMAYGPGSGGCPFHQGTPPGVTGDDGAQLSDADLAKWKAERDSFQAATKDLVFSLREKQLALEKVMSADKVDIDKAKALQKDISGISAQLDQKRIEHQVRMKELGFAAGPPEGRGPGCGQGAGYGCGRRGW
ncbi:MAG: periplasmic heavy metal sensor [Thermodesulfobacteriota bacterium]